jgi:hypothetical protein
LNGDGYNASPVNWDTPFQANARTGQQQVSSCTRLVDTDNIATVAEVCARSVTRAHQANTFDVLGEEEFNLAIIFRAFILWQFFVHHRCLIAMGMILVVERTRRRRSNMSKHGGRLKTYVCNGVAHPTRICRHALLDVDGKLTTDSARETRNIFAETENLILRSDALLFRGTLIKTQ